jgi:hypothetical protein
VIQEGRTEQRLRFHLLRRSGDDAPQEVDRLPRAVPQQVLAGFSGERSRIVGRREPRPAQQRGVVEEFVGIAQQQ